MLKYKENAKAIFNGVGRRIEFDKVVMERNEDTLREDPDMKILKLVYELKYATSQQIKDFMSKRSEASTKKIEERIKKLVKLRLITRYKLEYEEKKEKKTTHNIYMLDINGKNLLEGEGTTKVEWDLKDNLAIKSRPETFLKQLISNELVAKYLKESKTFYSFEIKPRIHYMSENVVNYIRPNALVNFGNEKKQVHFIVYSLRRNQGWQDEVKKIISYIEKIYMDFRPYGKLKQEPIVMFICEDEDQIVEFCKLAEGTKIPLSYTIYTTDEMIKTKRPSHSIAITKKDDKGEVTIEYPELLALS